MNKKIFLFVFYVISLSISLVAGNQIAIDTSKFNVNLNLGINCSFYLGNNYIKPDPSFVNGYHPAGGYYKSEPAVHFGVNVERKIYNNISVQSGLLFYNRKLIFETDYDSILKYAPQDSKYPLKHKTCYINIEWPLLVCYNISWKFQIVGGFKFSVFNNGYVWSKYIDLSENRKYLKSQFFRGPDLFYPELFILYSINKNVSLYFGADIKYLDNPDIQFGVKYKLVRK